jgi:hypothetical protein
MNVEPVIVLDGVRSLQWWAQIAARDSLTRLKIHPAHKSKHATIRAMCLMGLHLENLPKQIFVGGDPQEGLTHDNEARQL